MAVHFGTLSDHLAVILKVVCIVLLTSSKALNRTGPAHSGFWLVLTINWPKPDLRNGRPPQLIRNP